MASISIQDVRKGFRGARVLDGVSFDVRDGEFLSILGPSGCGKSTLLKLLAGLDTADSGEILIGGRSISALRADERDVAMVFQSYALYPHLSVGKNIAVPLEMRRLNAWQRFPLIGRILPGTKAIRSVINADVQKAAEQVRLTHRLERKPPQLSGGERQRVAIARAIVRKPSVLLMDEPLSNLDAQLRVAMRTELADLHRQLGLTIVFVTHDQSEAMSISDRVAVMMGGKLQQLASPSTLYDNPTNMGVAKFVGTAPINILAAKRVSADAVSAAGVHIRSETLLAGSPDVQFAIRPEWLLPASENDSESWEGSVTHVEYLGSEAVVRMQMAHDGSTTLYVRWDGDWPLPTVGELRRVKPRPGRGLLFNAQGDSIGRTIPVSNLSAVS